MVSNLTEDSGLTRFQAAKAVLRRKLIELPFPEKICRVIAMQKMASVFKRDKSRRVHVWRID